MYFSKEMIEEAKTASSAEDLLEIAKANGIELSADEAETYFSFLKDKGPLSDEELEQVAGGKGYPDPKYSIGQHLWIYYDNSKAWYEVVVCRYLRYIGNEHGCGDGWEYLVCGATYVFADKLCLDRMTKRVRTTKP